MGRGVGVKISWTIFVFLERDKTEEEEEEEEEEEKKLVHGRWLNSLWNPIIIKLYVRVYDVKTAKE